MPAYAANGMMLRDTALNAIQCMLKRLCRHRCGPFGHYKLPPGLEGRYLAGSKLAGVVFMS